MKGDSWTPFLPHPFTLWRLFLDCPVFGLRKCRDRENNQPTPPKGYFQRMSVLWLKKDDHGFWLGKDQSASCC